MARLKEQIVQLVASAPGMTDRELTDRLLGASAGQQAVNQAARSLAHGGHIVRRERTDGKIGNYPAGEVALQKNDSADNDSSAGLLSDLSEDDVKSKLRAWLEAEGWRVSVRWGRRHGIDLDAERDGQRWIIEAKGCGSLDAMRVNYFLAILGEILQRMEDPDARYSIALPDMKQFRGLWSRLPAVAKSRTRISALFVSPTGSVVEVH